MLCHNESGQLTGQFPAKAESLLEDTDFHACCREDRLDAARTDRMVQELETLAGTDCDLPLPRDARTGAVITVDSFVGRGAHWSYSTLSKAPCLPVAAILYWLADSLAGAERRTLHNIRSIRISICQQTFYHFLICLRRSITLVLFVPFGT